MRLLVLLLAAAPIASPALAQTAATAAPAQAAFTLAPLPYAPDARR